MRKKLLFFILLGLLILNLPFFISEENSDEEAKIAKAYECLDNKINNTCSKITLEQQIFSLLAVGECESDVKSSSKNKECWPNSSCRLKATAQAILALDRAGVKTLEAETWLLSQNKTSSDLEWFLQIESSNSAKCDITYGSALYSVNIGEDKKIDSNAGNCLTLAEGNYWLKISPSCYDYKFKISCNQDFLTNLLFKKPDSSTIHVLDKTSFGVAGEMTEEKINSLCFKQGNVCDYEGSLWAAFVLNSLDYDVSSFMPYLITMEDESINKKYLPESFLTSLGYGEYKNQLLARQKMGEYWFESGDKFYDTALALYPLYYDEISQKTNAMNWLLESQDQEGCWQGNIRNTAFILFSVWPKEIHEHPVCEGANCNITLADCEKSHYFCMPEIDCGLTDNGEVLELYDCNRPGYICCSKDVKQETCASQDGKICTSSEMCTGASVPASDVKYNEICCIEGQCKSEIIKSECENFGGNCKSSCGSDEAEEDYECGLLDEVCCISADEEKNECAEKKGICKSSCDSEEIEKSYECENSLDSCCVVEKSPNYLLVWILITLIVLIAIGIMFRNKLKIYFSGAFGKGSKKSRPSNYPPYGFDSPLRQQPRKIFPPSSSTTLNRSSPKKNSEELDDVLKKLKEMGDK